MIDIQLQEQSSRAVVSVDGQLFTEYRYGHYVCRPYFYPVLTPGGQRLTRGYPTEAIAGENEDHYHHRSIYVAHGLVNGHNLWDESTGHGAMLQRGDPVVGVEQDVATIDGMVDWFGPEGQHLLEERRSIRIWAEGDLRIVDYGDADSLAEAAVDCQVAVHLVGVIRESKATSYTEAHEDTCRALALAARAAGIEHIIYLSIFGADPASPPGSPRR